MSNISWRFYFVAGRQWSIMIQWYSSRWSSYFHNLSHTLSEQKWRKPASEADSALAAKSSNPNQMNRCSYFVSALRRTRWNKGKKYLSINKEDKSRRWQTFLVPYLQWLGPEQITRETHDTSCSSSHDSKRRHMGSPHYVPEAIKNGQEPRLKRILEHVLKLVDQLNWKIQEQTKIRHLHSAIHNNVGIS